MTGNDRHQALVDKLLEGIEALTSSERWQGYLDCQSRFHHYSYRNAMLVHLQRPSASQVAGFRAWRKLGRSVRKGEKAIWILAPMLSHRDGDDDEAVVRGFKFVPVFDVTQTDGRALPSVCDRLVGDDPDDVFPALRAVGESLGFHVVDHDFDGSVNGDCSHLERRIRIELRNSPLQRVKTLAHELAHALLHAEVEDRSVAELEAESVAYVVCQALGLETGGYSFGYVTSWAGGGDSAISGIRSSCSRIQSASAEVLEAVTSLRSDGLVAAISA